MRRRWLARLCAHDGNHHRLLGALGAGRALFWKESLWSRRWVVTAPVSVQKRRLRCGRPVAWLCSLDSSPNS